VSNNVIQSSFNAGEWAPALNARVDLKQYHSGAALLRNYFVDYRGGATTRPGTKFINQCLQPGARLIPFQASLTVSYMLEFGNGYIRFYNNGAPVVEPATTITAAAAGPPEVFTDAGHGYSNAQWIIVAGNTYIVENATTNTFTLTDLFGNAITANPFTLSASAQRIYTLGSLFVNADLQGLKFVQNVNTLIITSPNHPPQILTLITATNWTIAPINFEPTIATPSGVGVASTASAGGDATAYIVTAVDINGQESSPSPPTSIVSLDLSGTAWTNTVQFGAVAGAVSYNVYRSIITLANLIPAGVTFGFVGNCTGTTFLDTNINADFSQTPPIEQDPFSGAGVTSVTINNTGGGYGSVPTTTFATGGGVQATGYAIMTVPNAGDIALVNGGFGYQVGNQLTLPGGVTVQVTSTNSGQINGFILVSGGSVSFPSGLPTTNVGATGGSGIGATFNLSWGLQSIAVTNPGTDYLSAPGITFSGSGGAAATAVLGAGSSGNPTVPAFNQQRLVLAGPVLSPSQINWSQPGSPYNYNISQPTQADDAIQQTLQNTTLNTIQSMVSVSAGLIVLSDKGAWLINGGSAGSAYSALDIVANPQAYSGASSLPPIVTPNDILYVQAKNSIVRDLAYNFYLNNYVGTDISILSSHLFYGYQLIQWAWAEEPFKLAWAVRSDGELLSLTFAKEQELVAWAHHDTQGTYTSVASITENTVTLGEVDAVYVIVQRTVQGQTVQYIERMVELAYPNDYKSSWQVDAGIGYNGAPATTFSDAQALGGLVVTGVADGVAINFTMPTSGTFVFGPGGTAGLTGIASASIVTVGLAFTPQLQTLALDLGEPTVQGKRKKVGAVTTRVANALGLSAGKTLATVQPMKDLQIGNIGSMSNAPVNGLQTTDARMILDPYWDVFGQYYIVQPNPYPASILGVIPEIELGDSK
jgi:hypothetical protein